MLEADPRSRTERPIRQALLKSGSIASQLNLSFAGTGRPKTIKIKIKLDIDLNPPEGSCAEMTFLDFPADYEVRRQDLSSKLALKIHAMLCRPYLEERDWFDFSWYVERGTTPNLMIRQAALRQAGPCSGNADLAVDAIWLEEALAAKIETIDWPAASADVMHFLRPAEANSVVL